MLLLVLQHIGPLALHQPPSQRSCLCSRWASLPYSFALPRYSVHKYTIFTLQLSSQIIYMRGSPFDLLTVLLGSLLQSHLSAGAEYAVHQENDHAELFSSNSNLSYTGLSDPRRRDGAIRQPSYPWADRDPQGARMTTASSEAQVAASELTRYVPLFNRCQTPLLPPLHRCIAMLLISGVIFGPNSGRGGL